MPPSFLAPDILKHLCRELDRDKVEAEFSIKVSTTNSTGKLLPSDARQFVCLRDASLWRKRYG